MMGKTELIDKFIVKINEWESLDKEDFIRDLLHYMNDRQLHTALNLAGPSLEDLKTEWLKGRDVWSEE